MSEEAPRVTSLESMGILLWHLREQITRMEAQQHSDIKQLKETVATLASKQYVDDRLDGLRDEVNRTKPATLFRNVVTFCAGFAVVVAFVGLAIKIGAALDAVSSLKPSVVAK